ncbi:MAG TPA: glucosamine-6-phosphate deaminase [Puia sp.]|nr:glucosamine-6-phosphate deaminase [Puia sp.]
MNVFRVNLLEVRVAENREVLGRAAAEAVGRAITGLLRRRPVVNVMFAAAPSQNEFLAAFVQQRIDWSKVNGWHMDEYLGLDASAPQGFGNFLKERLFSKVPFREVYYMDGSADAEQECKRYAGLLAANWTDIVVLGIGENTHLAFNDPHVARFHDPQLVKIVSLDAACRQQQVNDGCFATLDEVPQRAMTVTIPALMRAKNVFAVVPGARKAAAVAHTLREKVGEKYPSTVLRRHLGAVLFLDEESAAEVRK